MKDILPILLGVLPFGMIYGASASGTHLAFAVAQAMSSIVFAGSAQFVTVQLIGAGIPAGMIILTAGIINLRHALYSASLAPYLKRLGPLWQMLLAYLLTDEAYAVTITHYQQRDASTYKHWYFLGASLALWCVWQASTAVGVVLGARIPASWSLDFTLPLTFIALVVPALKRRADVLAAVMAGIAAVLVARLPFNLGLLVATGIGIAAGIFVEAKSREKGRVGGGEENPGSSTVAQPELPLPSYTGEEREA